MEPKRRFSLADLLSLVRLPLAGSFVLVSDVVTQLAVVAIAACTDWLDGWVARRRGAGPYGAIIDPAADRVFVLVVLATLVAGGALTLAQCALLLLRDIATTIGAVATRLIPRWRTERLQARWSGKVVTALQFATLIALIVQPKTLAWMLPVVVVASVISILDYTRVLWGRRALVATVVGLVIGSAEVQAQGATRQPAFRPVVRADAFLARVDAFHAGAGLTREVGSYVRLDGVLGAGVARAGDATAASGRVEVVGRFLLDPFRQSRWGFYGGGGLIGRLDDGDDVRGYFTLVLGAELPGSGRVRPALEVGIGGGTRVALVVRRGRLDRR